MNKMTDLTGFTVIDTYNFVVEWAAAHKGNTPSYRVIANGCGFSVATAHDNVHALIKEGLLEQIDNALCVTRADFTLHADAMHFANGNGVKTKSAPEIVDRFASILQMEAIPANYHGATIKGLKSLGFTLGKAIDQHYRKATYPAGWRYEEIEGTNGESYLLADDKGTYRAVLHVAEEDKEKVVLTFLDE